MVVCNNPDIFQEKISEIFKGFDLVCAYIDDVLKITQNEFKYHLNALEKILLRLSEAVLKVNSEK